MTQHLHQAVNWVDGMKITKTHFIETDHYHTRQVRQALTVPVTVSGYGLCAADGRSLDLQLLTDAAGGLRVKVSYCRAVTPDGSLILIDPEVPVTLETSIDKILATYPAPPGKERDYYVVLTVDLFERIPSGQPRVDEEPVRHPYTMPSCSLKIVPTDLVNPSAWSGPGLVMARFNHFAAGLRSVQDYIPACVTTGSYQPLMAWLREFETRFRELETYSVRIIQKIRIKSQKSSLSDSVYALADRLVSGYSYSEPTLRIQASGCTPSALVALLLLPASCIRSVLITLTDREQEELLAYLGEWSDETPGNIGKQVQTMSQLTVNPLETAESLNAIRQFTDFWLNLFNRLSQLEFIGKRKGQQVFIVESPVHDPSPAPEKPKSRWSPI